MKDYILTAIGIIGGFIIQLVGGWNSALGTLLFVMGVDYVTGLIVAGVFKKSGKTKSGALESRAGFKGFCKKGVMLLIVMLGYRLDLMVGTTFVKDAVIIAFVVNEILSIIENAGLMGITMPTAITKAIEVLKKEGD